MTSLRFSVAGCHKRSIFMVKWLKALVQFSRYSRKPWNWLNICICDFDFSDQPVHLDHLGQQLSPGTHGPTKSPGPHGPTDSPWPPGKTGSTGPTRPTGHRIIWINGAKPNIWTTLTNRNTCANRISDHQDSKTKLLTQTIQVSKIRPIKIVNIQFLVNKKNHQFVISTT